MQQSHLHLSKISGPSIGSCKVAGQSGAGQQSLQLQDGKILTLGRKAAGGGLVEPRCQGPQRVCSVLAQCCDANWR
eukprot:349954-Chlamydomonas_euryale.AAC.7